MSSPQSAATCKWATPTLFLADKLWLDAWDYAWSCERLRTPRVLRAPESCITCPRWEERKHETRPAAATADV